MFGFHKFDNLERIEEYPTVHKRTAFVTIKPTVAYLISIETIYDGDGEDVIDLTSPTFYMAEINIAINGEEGNDTLWVADGHDILNGEAGDDILFGD